MARVRPSKSNKIKKQKVQKINKLEQILELPAILIENMPHIEMSGNREFIIEGSRGILEYDENLVKISAGKFAVTVFGRDLELKNLTDDSCIVTGNIDNVSFGV